MSLLKLSFPYKKTAKIKLEVSLFTGNCKIVAFVYFYCLIKLSMSDKNKTKNKDTRANTRILRIQ